MKTTGKIIAMACMCLIAYASRAGQSAIPWNDDFEDYTNKTPLIGGLNGWYASSAACIVQTNVRFSGDNAALIPVDCFLSNRFAPNGQTDIWCRLEVRPARYSGQTNRVTGMAQPLVDTNCAAMIFVDSNGYFVVHNGTNYPNATNSIKWVTLVTNAAGEKVEPLPVNTWAQMMVHMNYSATNWALYVNSVLLTNNIGFVKPAITSFNGFVIYNGGSTSYLDSAYANTNTSVVLAISVSPAAWDAGIVAAGSASMSSEIMVTNTGNVVETFKMRISGEDDKGVWHHSASKGGAGTDTYVLSGIFCAEAEASPPDLNSFNQAGSEDILTTTMQIAASTKFAYQQGTENGADVSANGGRALWLRLDAPTVAAGGIEHKITVRVGCIQP
jgi:hypothetical protein